MKDRLSHLEIQQLAGSAVRKIDQRGERGISQITWAEIEAMALLLVIHRCLLNTPKKKD